MIYRSPSLSLAKLLCLFCALCQFSTQAITHVIAQAPLDNKDKLQQYSYQLLQLALDVTKEEYGDYRLSRATIAMSRDRQFLELIKADKLNVMISPPQKGRGENAIRVAFPIQKGISSYRIFFLLNKNKDIFKEVNSIEELKKYSTGSNIQWSTTQILKYHQFNLVTSITYKGLFDMLNSERFISFNRGINEIFIELETFSKQFPELTYDQHIALFTYLPNYFYVSPSQPKLAKRLETGLLVLHNNGQLDELFYRYFGQYIDKIALQKRRFFTLENINLEPFMYIQDKPYLLDISKKISPQ